MKNGGNVEKFDICETGEEDAGVWKSREGGVEKCLENGLVFLDKVG